MRYFVWFCYDGTNYHGWQVQPNGITVQSELDGFDVGDFGFDVDTLPEFSFDTGEKQGDGSQQKDPTNSELDVDGFGDKIKMVLELSIEEHAFIQQRLSQDGMTKEQVLLNLLGYAEQ